MAALRKTPTPTNGGSGVGTNYTTAVDTEIEALWTCVPTFLTSIGGSANAITATSDTALVTGIAAYSRPMAFWLIPTASNTAAVTINIDTAGIVNVVDKDGNGLVAGALVANRLHLIIWDGTQFRVFSSPTPALQPTPAPDIILQEQQSLGVGGGTFTTGSWQLRTLNTVVRNVVAGASLASSILTLPAGTYAVEWSAPANSVSGHMSRLYNVTDSAIIATGSSEYSNTGGNYANTRSEGLFVFTLTATKNIRLEHACGSTQATTGLGEPSGMATEIYSWLRAWKTA
jgi:hypothetical protein